MKPSASSATAGTKPGEARVTSAPAAPRHAPGRGAVLGSGGRRCSRDIDVADVNCAPDEGPLLRQSRKYLPPAIRDAISDDDVNVLGRRDKSDCVERRIAIV